MLARLHCRRLTPLRPLSSRPRARSYNEDATCFGFRSPRPASIPDYTPAELANRNVNAPLLRYVESVRRHGHRAALIDPLDLLAREEVSALSPERYGLDLEESYNLTGIVHWTKAGEVKLRDVVERLRETYVGRIGYEYMNVPVKAERLWFDRHLEHAPSPTPISHLPSDRRRGYWELLARSETLDAFLGARFPNLKRYGLEGAESMLPALDVLFRISSLHGITDLVLSMPHRGRLSLLADLLRYPPRALFHKVRGNAECGEELSKLGATGDVVSHIVSSPELEYEGRKIKISMLQNPSHLEAINPVALGKARAKQTSLLRDFAIEPDSCSLGDRVLCLQVHGDAAFTGQGIVMESLGLSNLPHFTSGGSVHLVVNNSIGYTTPAANARSSPYASDPAKAINVPVLHVNADYPESVVQAIETAFLYRDKFRKDVVVDMLCYRRHGHNELDEPSYTQPVMYDKIRSRKSVPQLYEDKLISDGVLSPEAASSLRAEHKAFLDAELKAADTDYVARPDMLGHQWAHMVWPASAEAVHSPETGIAVDALREVGAKSVETPDGFEIHPRLQRHIKNRLKSLEAGTGIDFATAEALAFGTLLHEGFDVRISGQDVGRGTFSQRHAMLVDQKTEQVHIPLNASPAPSHGRLEIANSSLSELAVLGFEHGMTIDSPRLLGIWEAQFGDFGNGAQVVIDTFVASSEAKWLKQSGLVMLLPHGMDGAGPEHSSSRIERYLQLSNDPYYPNPHANVNISVANLTTPAQYFHLLRRQMHRNYRKPLIIASPKGLLRSSAAASSLSEMGHSTAFRPVLDDPSSLDPSTVRRILLLSGKLFYDLSAARATLPSDVQASVALVRIEELCPFPFAAVEAVLSRYNAAQEICWVQEEHRNQGGWAHVKERIDALLDASGRQERLRYLGRRESPAAVGVGKWHAREKELLLKEPFEGL